jgi:outer membrane protein W
MKKVLGLFLAVAMLAAFSFAQDVMPAAKAGSKSLNFTFQGIGTFGVGSAGPLGGVGGSYFLNNDAAVRAGLQVAYNTTSSTSNATSGGTDGSTSAFTLGAAVDYLMYMNAGRVRPYCGGGIYFTTTSSDTKPTDKAGFDEQKGGTPTTFGINGILGAEFFVYSEMSLSVEDQLNVIGITSYSDVQTTVGNTTTTQHPQPGSKLGILGFMAPMVGLHIYF